MIRVTTGSRLHFGLFSLPSEEPAVALQRRCGGVGLMIERPGVIVRAEPAASWSAAGPLPERALAIAQAAAVDGLKYAIQVENCPAEHVGLGTGTQLSLALGLAVGQVPRATCPTEVLDLARRLGRGQRSALGIHGFIHGGLLVEGGFKPTGESHGIAPLVARAEFPENWLVLLILPARSRGCHGQQERAAFSQLARHGPRDDSLCDALCRLTLLGMLPALHETDLATFGESLYEFNRKVGEMFRPAQGGIYSHPATEEAVRFLRRQGVPGVGQSSWGPMVFAVIDAGQAEDMVRLLWQGLAYKEEEVVVTRARNQGATCEIL